MLEPHDVFKEIGDLNKWRDECCVYILFPVYFALMALKKTPWLGEAAVLEMSPGLQVVKGPPESTALQAN